MKKYVVVAVIAALTAIVVRSAEGADRRLIEIAVKQEKQNAELGKLSRRIEGLEKRLIEIQKSLEKIAAAAKPPEAVKPAETAPSGPKVVEFKETPEYGQIAGQLTDIQQKLSTMQSNLTKTQEDGAREAERARLRDPAATWGAMNNPQELSSRLTAFGQNYALKIEDPLKRQQFEVDIEQFKRSLSEKPSTQQLYDRVTAQLNERLNSEQDQRAQEFVQRQLNELQAASGEELQGRLERYSRFDTVRQLRQLQEKYSIPREALGDAGLPAMGGEGRGPGGGERGPRMQGGRGGQQGGAPGR